MNGNCCQTTANDSDNGLIPSSNEYTFSPPMNNSTDPSIGNNSSAVSDSSTTDIVQIPILLLIDILAFAYIILILNRKTFRSNKFTWPNVNICFATAFFSIIQLVFTIIRLENLTNILISCRSQGFIVNMAACHVIYSLCMSSIIRLLSIRYFNKPLFRSSRWLLGSIGFGWVIGLLAAVPYLFYDSFTCSSNDGDDFLKPYSCITTLVIPVGIVAVCNLSIFWHVRQSTRRVHNIENNRMNDNIARKRDWQLSKIMMLTFGVFVIGWTPIFFEQLFTNDERRLPTEVSSFFQMLLLVSLLGEIILLIYSNQPVRHLIKEALKCNRIIPCIIKC